MAHTQLICIKLQEKDLVLKIVITFIFLFTLQASKASIVATLPELGWVVAQLLPDEKVKNLLSGHEDPHFIDAVPSFIVKASKAKVLILNGMQLEMGWLPKVIQMAGNSKINFGQLGYCDASKDIKKLQVLKNFDRSMGDVHPVGNPHYSLSVTQMRVVSKTILECLQTNFPEKSEILVVNYKELDRKLIKLESEFKKELNSLKAKKFMSYHLEFVYFFSDFGLESAGNLEKIPGILPSASHLLAVAKKAKEEQVSLVLAGTTNPQKYLEKFKESTKIPYIQLDLHMTNKYSSYIDYQKELLKKILAHAN